MKDTGQLEAPKLTERPESEKTVEQWISSIPNKEWLNDLIRERKFPIVHQIPGNDAHSPPLCRIEESTCDLCSHFIASALCKDSFDYSGSRWLLEKNTRCFHHYSSLRNLTESSKNGCRLCSLVLSVLPADASHMFLQHWFYDQKSPFIGDRRSATFSVRYFHPKTNWSYSSLFNFLVAKDSDEALTLPDTATTAIAGSFGIALRSITPFDPLSDDTQLIVDKWITSCSKSHDQCARRQNVRPKRLLSLCPEGRQSEQVQLVYSTDLEGALQNSPYIALSYCWGEGSRLKTTKSNLSHLHSGFPASDLPQVIQDAIKICRRCRVNFLWVDSLCICQDDNDEWEEQAAQMADVYGGCLFAISALSSSKVSEGILPKKTFQPVRVGNVAIDYGTWKDEQGLFLRWIPRNIEREFSLSTLNQRGWPFQERLLAPAVLHFGHDQLMWECNTTYLLSTSCESWRYREYSLRLSGSSTVEGLDGSVDLWESLVEDFSRRRLTYAKDRVFAISGVASRLKKDDPQKGRYVAGHWEPNLTKQLLWHKVGAGNTNQNILEQPNLNFPSWSWARWNSGVKIENRWMSSALQSVPAFVFDESHESQKLQLLRSGKETTADFCAVKLHGFVQSFNTAPIEAEPTLMSSSFSIEAWRRYSFPASYGQISFDHLPLPPGPFYTVRLLEGLFRKGNDSISQTAAYIILHRKPVFKEKAASPGPFDVEPSNSWIFHRVGIMRLENLFTKEYQRPYKDVNYRDGRRCLFDGEWRNILLV